jgi:hypothetical protein
MARPLPGMYKKMPPARKAKALLAQCIEQIDYKLIFRIILLVDNRLLTME